MSIRLIPIKKKIMSACYVTVCYRMLVLPYVSTVILLVLIAGRLTSDQIVIYRLAVDVFRLRSVVVRRIDERVALPWLPD